MFTSSFVPGRRVIREFLATQSVPFLPHIPQEEKVNKIHTKLFNERAKVRRKLDLGVKNLQK